MSNQSEISAATFYWLCPRDILNQGRQTIALFHYEDPMNDSVGEALCVTRNLKVSIAGFIPM